MKNKEIINVLKYLGLSENEANIYFTSLSLGPSTILKISKGSEIKRTSCYSIIESLKNKGLISSQIKGFKKLLVAEPPEKLETIINSRKERLKKIIPQMDALYNFKGNESLIKYYEGLEACKNIYLKILQELKPNDFYLVVNDRDRWFELDAQFFENFLTKRKKINVKIRSLLQDSALARKHKKIQHNLKEKIKILPPEIKLTTNLLITPKKVVIHQLIHPIFAIVIENKSIVRMNKEMFEIIWRSLN